MIKIREEKITVTRYIDTFICDRCGKEIGESVEADDGYCKPHGHSIHFIIGSDWLDGLLCDECAQKLERDLQLFRDRIARRNHFKINDEDIDWKDEKDEGSKEEESC
jgi:hypothetical protein